jgi:hypothetical protein
MDDDEDQLIPLKTNNINSSNDKEYSSSCFHKTASSFSQVRQSLYFYANVVYVIYSSGMLLINYSDIDTDMQNFYYMLFGIVHCVNAAMYIWMWKETRNIFTCFILADWLNVIGAIIYLITAIMYPYEYTSDDDNANETRIFVIVRYFELIASIIELIAAIGWNYQWYATYIEAYNRDKKSTIGRGFTLDDPDLWANITIFIGAFYYFYYNISLFVNNFNNYDTNYTFETGDLFYFINSIFYLICSLRDCDVFWFMPTAGIWPTD